MLRFPLTWVHIETSCRFPGAHRSRRPLYNLKVGERRNLMKKEGEAGSC